MNQLDEHEAIRNLNPATDKLGRDRDFKDNTCQSLKWMTDKINNIDERLQLIEGIIRSEHEEMPKM